MAIKIIGKGRFGVDSTIEGAQSASENRTCSENVALNKDGEPMGVVLSNETVEKTLEVLVTGDDDAPALGEVYDGGTVTAVSLSSSNSDFRKYSITIKTWGELGGETTAVTTE